MNYPNIYKAIAKTGYSGYICMEYLPLADPVASLKKSVDEMRANLA
jgi:hydroxypyruvate isomerase